MKLCAGCRYLPAIGRFLIVVTFVEDAFRIITQWSDQLTYLQDYRHSKPLSNRTQPFLPQTAASQKLTLTLSLSTQKSPGA
jgi:hypothetical protein